jgi:predicted ATP-dependent Lon-type protease
LEFLLARYCASDDPREIQEGLAAVLDTIQKYVRPDESNRAQMLVQQKESTPSSIKFTSIFRKRKTSVGSYGEFQLSSNRHQ